MRFRDFDEADDVYVLASLDLTPGLRRELERLSDPSNFMPAERSADQRVYDELASTLGGRSSAAQDDEARELDSKMADFLRYQAGKTFDELTAEAETDPKAAGKKASPKALKPKTPEAARTSEWVSATSGVFKMGGRLEIRGVGSSQAMRSQRLASSLAQAQAVQEAGKVVMTLLVVLQKDHLAVASADGMEAPEGAWEPDRIVAAVMRGSVEGPTWSDPSDKTLFVAVSLDAAAVKRGIEEVAAIDPGLRRYLSENVEKGLDDLFSEQSSQ